MHEALSPGPESDVCFPKPNGEQWGYQKSESNEMSVGKSMPKT